MANMYEKFVPVIHREGLTTAEFDFVQNLAGLSYSTGDILYYNGLDLTRLPIGSAGQVLTVTGGIPDWENASIGGGTLTGNIILGENTGIVLDPALSADGKYSAIELMTGTGGATIAIGDLVTLDKDDSRWELVDISVAAAATGDARGIIGIAVTTSTDGGAITVMLRGTIRADSVFPTLTIGAAVFASTTGDIVVTQPTTTDYVIRIIGYGLTASELRFCPENDWTTHT